ncbi:MAG: CbiX/SirB N-terminal domain-containing protein, partial [Planctomycetota bacterium]
MPNFTEQLQCIVGDNATVGLVIVDHGSRRQQSNALLDEVVAMFKQTTGATLVEPAHMELAEPSIATAFDRCVEQGADWVVVFPYFLSPGRHWHADIPQLAAEAAAKHPGVRHLVTAPLGLHEGMASIMQDRMTHCLSRVLGQAD